MAFVLMKLVKPLFLPATLILIGMLLSWWGMRRGRWWARRILLATAVFYYILSIGPTAAFVIGSLERQYPPPSQLPTAESVDAIVVLAGGATLPNGSQPSELSGSSWRRLWKGIEVARSYQGKVPLLYSGGSGDPFQTESKEAKRACEIAAIAGVAISTCQMDDNSRTTFESGQNVGQWLERSVAHKEPYTIILVTSAYHMPRSVRVMRSRALTVIPAPADYQYDGQRLSPLSLFPSIERFNQSAAGIHERLGMLWYRLKGL